MDAVSVENSVISKLKTILFTCMQLWLYSFFYRVIAIANYEMKACNTNIMKSDVMGHTVLILTGMLRNSNTCIWDRLNCFIAPIDSEQWLIIFVDLCSSYRR